MEYIVCDGSILESTAQIIVHQVNCQARMGSGVAKAIKDAYPKVYESYMAFCEKHTMPEDRLGNIDIVKVSRKQAVCNLFGQLNYGYDGKKYTSYDAVAEALWKLRDFCIEKGVKNVAFPQDMGCGLGGGRWNIIGMMIIDAFNETDVSVEIWQYGKKEAKVSG